MSIKVATLVCVCKFYINHVNDAMSALGDCIRRLFFLDKDMSSHFGVNFTIQTLCYSPKMAYRII